jgi:competence protein ComGC
MLCSRCGNEISEDAEFCNSCGAPASPAGEQQAPAADAQAPYPEQLESPLPAGPLPFEQTEEAYPGGFVEAPKRRISVAVLFVTSMVLVALLGTAIIIPLVLISKNSQKKAQKSTCQANQRTIDNAIMTYAAMSPDETYPSSLDDLSNEGLLHSIPTCPAGTLPYTWVKSGIGSPPSISCPNSADHAL